MYSYCHYEKSMKSYFIDIPSFKEAVFIKHGFLSVPCSFLIPKPVGKASPPYESLPFENTGRLDG